MKILITAPIMLKHLEKHRAIFDKAGIEVSKPPFDFKESLNEEQLKSCLLGIDGILCGDDQLNSNVIDACPNLKAISKWGTGVDSIDCDYARQKGVHVSRVKDVFSHPVSDSVMGYIILQCRKLNEKNEMVRSGHWGKLPGFCLNERTLGIIGGGAIGSCLAKKALAFGMKVFIVDTDRKDISRFESSNIEQAELSTMLKQADFVSLNCDYNPSSHYILSEEQFSLMKSTACVINTARGKLIQESALVKALERKKIAGAFLDVYEVEPLSQDNLLRKFDNVFFSPHNTNASEQVEHLVCERSAHNLLEGIGCKDKVSL
jgi:D-3-phosphoglycerate dehydrogenase / 2-oxoglutarate reductase